MKDWKKIKHLYLRAGFGLNQDELESKKKSSLSNEIKSILKINESSFKMKIPKEFTDLKEDSSMMMSSGKPVGKEDVSKAKKLTPLVNVDWVQHMATTSDPLLEKMTLFWHGHFACQSKLPNLATIQINTIRKNALGNFKDLVNGIAQDPSMILYLNNQQNSKRKPNENFARELMELFTIGIGNYSEDDVKEAGRAFTGWRANQFKGKSEFIPRRHDSGSKTFMGKTGNFNGEDIVDILLEKKETARFIARKVYKYFVNPKLDDNHVDSIADTFYHSNYDISKMMTFIFNSDWFYDEKNIGIKIKSPLELIVGMMKTLNIEFKVHTPLLMLQRNLGQVLFNPPNVAGWPGDKSWIDNATLLTRLNLPALFLISRNVNVQGGKKKSKFLSALSNKKIDIQYFTQQASDLSNEQLADSYVKDLIQAPLSVSKQVLYTRIQGSTGQDVAKNILYRVMSLPEYQIC